MTAVIFPGQGSQKTGMSKDFYDNFSIAKETIQEIESSVSLNLKKIIFENEGNLLDITKYTQLSIFACSLMIFKTLEQQFNLSKSNINTMLGHSLGEYSALTCSGKLSLDSCSRLLKLRGELMNDAAGENITGMAALIGLSSEIVEKLIIQNKLNIEIANDNSPIQVVISGEIEEIEKSKIYFDKVGLKKFVKLNVSSAFHSKFMLNAQEILNVEIDKMNFMSNDINIVSNYSSKITSDNNEIINSLKNQMANRVKWKDSIINLSQYGEDKLIEIGPSKVLSGLVKRIINVFKITSIDSINDLNNIKL